MNHKRVVITGMGSISPLGLSTAEFWDGCLLGKQRATQIPDKWLEYAEYSSRYWIPLPKIDFTQLGISRIDNMRLDPVSKLSQRAAAEAIADTGLETLPLDRRQSMFKLVGVDAARAGVIMGTGIGGLHTTLESHSVHLLNSYRSELEQVLDKEELDDQVRDALLRLYNRMDCPQRYNPFTVSMIMNNSVSANIGIRYGCKGTNKAISVACASGTAALGHAFNSIRNGCHDLIISGGAEYKYDETGAVFRGYDIAGTLAHGFSSPEEANRPFDRRRNGFMFSEGAVAVLVLEELQHALARGANIVSEIAAYAETCDAQSIMQPDPEGIQIERMIRDALRQADLVENELDYINAHGTGTLANDEMEVGVVQRIFGEGPVVNSTKSLVGHTIGASGALEAQVAALSIRDQKVHGNLNLKDPISSIRLPGKQESCRVGTVLSHSFAFGGHNCALVFKEFTGS